MLRLILSQRPGRTGTRFQALHTSRPSYAPKASLETTDKPYFSPVNSIYYTVWPSHKNINNQPRSKAVLMSDYMDLHRTSYQAFTPELQSCRHLATVLLTRKCTLTAEERSNKKVSRLRKTFSTMLSVSVPTSISLSVDVNMKASRCSRLIEVCSSQASTWRSFFHRILKKTKICSPVHWHDGCQWEGCV